MLSSTYSVVNASTYLRSCTPTQSYFCKARERILVAYFASMDFFEVCVVEVEGKYGRIRHKLKVNLAHAFFLAVKCLE